MKPATAAKKLGVLLSETPADFQEGEVTRSEFSALQSDPPEWLATLRREGPHPRQVVAAKLGVSTSGLARGGATDPLTTAEIKALLESPPPWLVTERATQAAVRTQKAREKSARDDAERARQRAER
ncbi:MAG: DUF5997 family protein [Microbacteriaceae bacterium]